MSKILPSQLTDEQILELLSSEDQLWNEDIVNVFNYDSDIVPFLSNYGITPGNTRVSKKLIYNLYKTYSKEPITQVQFTTQMATYISHDRDNFLINIDTFAISRYIYEAQKTRDKTKSLTYQKHFNWFIKEAGVETGRVWLEGFILFFMYKDFCKSRRVNPKLGYVNFHKFLKLHFPYKRLKGNRALFFKVNEETENFYSGEEREQIRQARTAKETRGSKKDIQSEPETSKTE